MGGFVSVARGGGGSLAGRASAPGCGRRQIITRGVVDLRASDARAETRRGRDATHLSPTRGRPRREEVPMTVAIFRAARRGCAATDRAGAVVDKRFGRADGATNGRSGRESECSLRAARGEKRATLGRIWRVSSDATAARSRVNARLHPRGHARAPRDDGDGERARSGAGGGDRFRATRRGHEARADGHGPGGAVRVRARGVRETCVARVRPFSFPPRAPRTRAPNHPSRPR